MTYLQIFGLAFVILHSICILFINKLSLGKRLFLAVWMAAFVLGVPLIYFSLPSIAFIAISAVALSIYVLTLFYQESKGLRRRLFRKRRRSMSVEDLWDIEDREPQPVSQMQATGVVNSPVSAPASASLNDRQLSAVQPKAEKQADLSAKEETSLLNDMLQKLDQIDNLLSKDGMTASEASAEAERLSQSLEDYEPETDSQSALDQDRAGSAGQSSSLEAMFFDKSRPADSHQEPVDEKLLLNEIDDIIASHTDLEKEWAAHSSDGWSAVGKEEETELALSQVSSPSAQGADQTEVFTLRPIAEQTIEIIKEKQDEDGLLSVEEQLDKELYFQFLLYESKELLAMGMYQETVDYLREILIDSYDKALRREALNLLESVKVDLYHPQALGYMNKDLKKVRGA